jgi:hypothetical protein
LVLTILGSQFGSRVKEPSLPKGAAVLFAFLEVGGKCPLNTLKGIKDSSSLTGGNGENGGRGSCGEKVKHPRTPEMKGKFFVNR